MYHARIIVPWMYQIIKFDLRNKSVLKIIRSSFFFNDSMVCYRNDF